jgi:hypothetical protein
MTKINDSVKIIFDLQETFGINLDIQVLVNAKNAVVISFITGEFVISTTITSDLSYDFEVVKDSDDDYAEFKTHYYEDLKLLITDFKNDIINMIQKSGLLG